MIDDSFRAENVVRALTRERRPAPLAACPADGEPLIATFAFSGAEFYCLVCGGLYGWMAPTAVEATPELDARHDQLQAEWEALGGRNLIGGGVMLKACATCQRESEPHMRHATSEELRAHSDALEALARRAEKSRTKPEEGGA